MDLETLGRLTASVQATPGVAFAAPPLSNQRADAAVVFVVPDTAPQAVETEELIEPLRNDLVPTVLHGSGDRKSVVSGKSVSVRVALGGRRIIKKKMKLINRRITHPRQRCPKQKI